MHLLSLAFREDFKMCRNTPQIKHKLHPYMLYNLHRFRTRRINTLSKTGTPLNVITLCTCKSGKFYLPMVPSYGKVRTIVNKHCPPVGQLAKCGNAFITHSPDESNVAAMASVIRKIVSTVAAPKPVGPYR